MIIFEKLWNVFSDVFWALMVMTALLGCKPKEILYEYGQTLYFKPEMQSNDMKFFKCENHGELKTGHLFDNFLFASSVEYRITISCMTGPRDYIVSQDALTLCPQEPEKIEKFVEKCEK